MILPSTPMEGGYCEEFITKQGLTVSMHRSEGIDKQGKGETEKSTNV